MPSMSSLDFLKRQGVIGNTHRGGRFQMGVLHTHTRPVIPLPDLLPPDTPSARGLMQPLEDRPAYQGERNTPCPPCSG